jgi:hypothetical protein
MLGDERNASNIREKKDCEQKGRRRSRRVRSREPPFIILLTNTLLPNVQGPKSHEITGSSHMRTSDLSPAISNAKVCKPRRLKEHTARSRLRFFRNHVVSLISGIVIRSTGFFFSIMRISFWHSSVICRPRGNANLPFRMLYAVLSKFLGSRGSVNGYQPTSMMYRWTAQDHTSAAFPS